MRRPSAFHPVAVLTSVVALLAAVAVPSGGVATAGAPAPAAEAATVEIASPSAPVAPTAPVDEDVWVVSTRRLPDIRQLPSHASLGIERLSFDGACNRWTPSDLDSLLEDPQRPLMIFIHGNRYDPASAKSQGLTLARRVATSRPDQVPIRTVIFSWPSSQEGLLLRDSRAKYERSMTEGYYFAWLLGQMHPERPVAIVAYSYGGLIALEALDNLVAAERTGRSLLQPWIDRPARLHLVFVAAAVRQDALAPCGEYRRVIPCIDRLTLLNNSRDQALRFFEFIDPSLRTEALGHEHMPARWLPPEVEFTQVDAASIVGKSHRFPPYLDAPSLRRRIVAGVADGLAHE